MTVPLPVGRAVDVWVADTSRVALTDAGLATLGEAETARAAAFAFATDRRRYQAAHVVLRAILAGYTGIAPGGLTFATTPCPTCGRPSGRPVLESGGPAFSLAHSGEVAVTAVADSPVGVDAERLRTRCVCSLARQMHAGDAAAVSALTEPERHEAVIRWWVRAEAVLKCTGTGIAHGMGHVRVLAEDPGSAAGCSLAAYPAPPGFLGAVALAGGGGVDVRMRTWPAGGRAAGR